MLKYGIKDGELISVEKVMSGLNCGCRCPSCGAPLVAKKGNKREHHFAHHNAEDCGKGRESALHLMAKKILEAKKELFVPNETGEGSGAIRCFSEVDLESRKFSKVIPDVVMEKDGERLCVEILVTHAVDEEKEKKLFAEKLPTVEIDLSDYLDDFDEEIVTQVLLTGQNTRWIYNSFIDEQRRKRKITDEICDYLPESGWERYNCPYLKKPVTFLHGSHSCHECIYFNYQTSREYRPSMPCNYRERELLKLEVKDCQNIERKNGMLISIDIQTGNNGFCWEEHWSGDVENDLEKGWNLETKKEVKTDSTASGKTILELWKPKYREMIVRNVNTSEVMYIYGTNGNMWMRGDMIIGKYCHEYRGYYQTHGDYYKVWGYKAPIWELVEAHIETK